MNIDEAQYYVSCRPEPNQLRAMPELEGLLDSVKLPCWLPHRRLADALGHSHEAIEAAEAACGGGYCWASEFENVHTLWPVRERGFYVGGVRFAGPEQYYQVHKHTDAALWPSETTPAFEQALREVAEATEEGAYWWGSGCSLRPDWDTAQLQVMKQAIGSKFRADPKLRELLISTAPAPLASVKHDRFWGIGMDGRGQNMLPKLLMELRGELLEEDANMAEATDTTQRRQASQKPAD
jgi:ribA/ribD-fused uncharacterized protein